MRRLVFPPSNTRKGMQKCAQIYSFLENSGEGTSSIVAYPFFVVACFNIAERHLRAFTGLPFDLCFMRTTESCAALGEALGAVAAASVKDKRGSVRLDRL